MCELQLKPGQQIPSPSELMGKILIKNKKGSHEKPVQNKKTTTAASEQTTTTAAASPGHKQPIPGSCAQHPGEPRWLHQAKTDYTPKIGLLF